ncbi:uncharacterized protein LOC115727539 [Rhodamnia argentea]|uniref:RING-type E3 ubiquitin transferase n=1 Tax=Rhodamnia argentea TaxID=178133 RepID=A0A8B8MU98_9MYRT|nr:uncharacterized protein LOC115727539 [Rhodamnia argentea]
MASTTMFPHLCEAWQPQNPVPEETLPQHDEFLIEIYASFVYVRMGSDDAGRSNNPHISPTTYKPFRHSRDHLVRDATSWSTISSMLSQVNVPYHVQPLMIMKIHEAARSIANASVNKGLRTLPMVVSIRVVQEVTGETSPVSEEQAEWMSTRASGLRAASWSSIQALEKVKVRGSEEKCVICLDRVMVGSEAVQMPCLHNYHEECIVNWLQRSNLCPLCRFPMPM